MVTSKKHTRIIGTSVLLTLHRGKCLGRTPSMLGVKSRTGPMIVLCAFGE